MVTVNAADGLITTSSLAPGTFPVLQLEPTSQSPLEVATQVTCG